MKKMLLIALFFYLQTVYAKTQVLMQVSRSIANESPFKKYGDEFMALAEKHGYPESEVGKIRMRFGNPEPSELSNSNLATCSLVVIDGVRTIDVDEKQWRYLPDQCRRALVWHEMAHCGLDKGHTEAGLMRPILDCDAATEEGFLEMFHAPPL